MGKLAVILVSFIMLVGFSAAQNTSFKEGSDSITSYDFDLEGKIYNANNPDVYGPSGSQGYSDEYNPRVVMTGEVSFRTGGYTVNTTSKKDGDLVTFIVKASSPNEDFNTQQIDEKIVAENLKVSPGLYTGVVKLYLDGNLVHNTKEKVEVRNSTEKTEDVENEDLNSSERVSDQEKSKFSNVSRGELIAEIKRLKGLVQQLRENMAEEPHRDREKISTNNRTQEIEEETDKRNKSASGEGSSEVNKTKSSEERKNTGRSTSQKEEQTEKKKRGFLGNLFGDIWG